MMPEPKHLTIQIHSSNGTKGEGYYIRCCVFRNNESLQQRVNDMMGRVLAAMEDSVMQRKAELERKKAEEVVLEWHQKPEYTQGFIQRQHMVIVMRCIQDAEKAGESTRVAERILKPVKAVSITKAMFFDPSSSGMITIDWRDLLEDGESTVNCYLVFRLERQGRIIAYGVYDLATVMKDKRKMSGSLPLEWTISKTPATRPRINFEIQILPLPEAGLEASFWGMPENVENGDDENDGNSPLFRMGSMINGQSMWNALLDRSLVSHPYGCFEMNALFEDEDPVSTTGSMSQSNFHNAAMYQSDATAQRTPRGAISGKIQEEVEEPATH